MTLTKDQYGQEFIDSGYCLSQIPDFQGLLPKSHAAGVPIFELTDAEIKETGPILAGLKERRQKFKKQFEEISNEISQLIKYA